MVDLPIDATASNAGSLVNQVTAYEFDYFSGTQIQIYIGDILIDDAYSIQFQATQTKRPIYGYGSQYFHTVADGQVLVEGSFAVSFKEADYILATLDYYRQAMAPIEIGQTDAREGYLGDELGLNLNSQNEHRVRRENIERRIQRLYHENQSEKEGGLHLGAGEFDLARDLAALDDQQFEDFAETFEDVLWNKPEADFLSGNIKINEYNLGTDVRRADQYPPFDIYILYGDIANKAANHTIKKLIDVSIVGQGQAITVGGEPVAEFYRFIAKNLA
jgi:hypothetical protein